MTFLKPEALKRYMGTIDAATQRHMQAEWDGKGEVKVFPLAKVYTFSLACCLFGSIEDEECLQRLEHEFEHLLKGVVSLPLDFPGIAYHRVERAANAIKNELRPVIERKRSDLEQKIMRPVLIRRLPDSNHTTERESKSSNILLGPNFEPLLASEWESSNGGTPDQELLMCPSPSLGEGYGDISGTAPAPAPMPVGTLSNAANVLEGYVLRSATERERETEKGNGDGERERSSGKVEGRVGRERRERGGRGRGVAQHGPRGLTLS
ncbi:hypothetical protein ACLOJK_029900 [Asimina triloba]